MWTACSGVSRREESTLTTNYYQTSNYHKTVKVQDPPPHPTIIVINPRQFYFPSVFCHLNFSINIRSNSR